MSHAKYGDFYLDEFPIIVSEVYPINPTIEAVDEYFDRLDEILGSFDGPYCFIAYGKDPKFVSSDARIRLAKRATEITNKYRYRSKGDYLVNSGVISQLLLKAIGTIYKPLKDTIIVNTLEEALTAARKNLEL